jgi:hypothetical protein
MHYFIYIVNLMLTTLLLCVSLLYGEAMFVLVSCILMIVIVQDMKQQLERDDNHEGE